MMVQLGNPFLLKGNFILALAQTSSDQWQVS
jgi:hypothetical protein